MQTKHGSSSQTKCDEKYGGKIIYSDWCLNSVHGLAKIVLGPTGQ